ncbi:hypothetical protein K431DRAFT_290340 [Polychaeton citri CBS 116435]|uniref:Uncharacterized protein n=1 Tax=Polychaeton citri CBS 116435 TaxID=1314669 RepID=A0A9P4UUI6_9PEZI|nr:hypothetical protein K431DRAFT_290340 [Polychaeton citri CBS 116435]
MRSPPDKPQPHVQLPMRIPVRLRSPSKALTEENTPYNPPPRPPGYFDGAGAIESIQEDSELELPPRPSHLAQFAPIRSSSLQRRRPPSPLHHSQSAPVSAGFPASIIDQNANFNVSGASSGASSPALGPQRYNESYPSLHHYASNSSFSSMPSTPTSARSRSPSISSLDTIEDEPDLESEAVEQEREDRLKMAEERADRMERGEEEEDPRRRRSLDAPRQGFGFGRGGGMARERKRWSVCGGERRTDLDLETIWED